MGPFHEEEIGWVREANLLDLFAQIDSWMDGDDQWTMELPIIPSLFSVNRSQMSHSNFVMSHR